MSQTLDIVATGHLACELRCGVKLLLRAAAMLKIAPAVRINGVAYYHAADAERLGEQVRQLQNTHNRL